MKKTLILLVLFKIYVVQVNAAIHIVPGNFDSIQEAIEASTHGDTVLVEPNIYYENIDFKGKNIVIGSHFLTTRDTSMISRTIIDGSANGSVVTIKNNEDSTAMLIGLTIRNGKYDHGGGINIEYASPSVYNCVIMNNTIEASNPFGGGIRIRNGRADIYSCEIKYNTATGKDNWNGWGGGIGAVESQGEITITNCKIHDNQVTSSYGGIGLINSSAKIAGCEISNNFSYSSASGIGCQDSYLELTNSTIVQNVATLRNDALYFIRSSPVITNCIIWHNEDKGSYGAISGWGGYPVILYSNIEGGFDTLEVMDLNPMFADTAIGDFRLRSNSPCIDAGDPVSSGLNLPTYDLFGNLRLQDGDDDGITVIDMGAYEYGSQSVGIESTMTPKRPNSFRLNQNYPNPFNSATQITFSLPEEKEVNLTIYNVMGKKIITLVDGKQSKGDHSVIWSGTDHLNQDVSSGLYIYQLKVGHIVLNKKMIILE